MPKTRMDTSPVEPSTVLDTVIVHGRAVSGFSRLTPSVALSLQRSMLDAAGDCGCKAGTMAVVAALSVYLILYGVLPWLVGQPMGLTRLGGALVGLGAGIVGKVLGLQLADRRLQSSIERFEDTRART